MRILLFLSFFLACKSTDSARQGGADFKTVTPEKLESKFEDVAGICFQTQTVGKIILDFADPSIGFESTDGATNSTGRCVREIASNFVFSTRPNGKIEVTAPKQPMNGWAVADWVKLLAPQRFAADRGLLDPAETLGSCLQGVTLTATVIHSSGVFVEVNPPSESARCVSAVLASIAWPSQKNLSFTLTPNNTQTQLKRYFRPESDTLPPLAPENVSQVIKGASAQVSACWNEALNRRTGIGGAKTFRFRVNAKGNLSAAWVAESSITVNDFILDACLENALFSLQFEPSAGEGVYTWNFASR